MTLVPKELASVDVAQIKSIWSELVEDDEGLSPDKYYMFLDYMQGALEGRLDDRTDRTNIGICIMAQESGDLVPGFTVSKGEHLAVLHAIHARPKSFDNGWLKVQSTRFTPRLDPDAIEFEHGICVHAASSLWASCVVEAILYAKSKGIKLLKYYAGRDMAALMAVAYGINSSNVGAKLGIEASKKGSWVEISIN